MIASILCPGPSLAKLTQAQIDATTVIAVNRAAHRVRCDWWVFLDDRIWKTYPLDYRPKICATREVERRIDEKFELTTDELRDQFSPAAGWTIYSFTSAIVLAAHLGAARAVIYGCDWAGHADFDGHLYRFSNEHAEQTRSDDRWKREREIFERTCALLAGQLHIERVIYGNP